MVKSQWNRSQAEGIASALEALAQQIRQLMHDGERAQPKGKAGLEVGQRVRITRRDKYQGRIATIVSRRGTMYWNLLLEARDGEVARMIHKMDDGLVLIGDS